MTDTDHKHDHTDKAVSPVQPVAVPYEAVLNRVSRHYADENARLVGQLAMAMEENTALRALLAERDAELAAVRDAA